ncbi:MAG: MBL fold metallo-hydrolase [Oscillospiraceae bacterium]|nr:MBL fold metallo-hydrolase [Oscillospiraceae bacterium]
MIPFDITLTANAGVMLRCKDSKLFCDALHRHKTENFSALSPEMQAKMVSSPEFFGVDAMISTHKHPDHYSKTLITAAKKLMPDAVLISPAPDFSDQILLTDERHNVHLKDFELDFIRLTHEGAQFADVANYGFLLSICEKNILITGDSHIAEPKIADWLGGRTVDLALLNFPWLTLRRGREFITDVIKPNHVMFYHIPFAQDDRCGFRDACKKSLPLLDEKFAPRLLSEPFQTEHILL